MRRLAKLMTLLALIAGSGSAVWAAGAKTASGNYNGKTWTAQSTIVGQRSTASIAGGGNSGYLARADRFRSTVGLLMQYADGSAFVCSGSMLSDRASIVTAGHCVSDGKGTEGPAKITAFFYDGNAADPTVYDALLGRPAPGVTMVGISKVFVEDGYTGAVVDQNDIAVLRLATAPPSYAKGYDLYTGTDLTGRSYTAAGYGLRSDVGGAVGADLNPGRFRQGNNRYDFRLGDRDFGGFFESRGAGCPAGSNFFCTDAQIGYSFLSDFDNGFARNDASCLLAVEGFGVTPSGKYCQLGRGATESSTAQGDSGGPEFIDGMLASVTSYGLSFGTDLGDTDDVIDSTFGEFNGFVPVFLHLGFIASAVAAPEPATWLMMIAGFGLIGGAMRRRGMLVAA